MGLNSLIHAYAVACDMRGAVACLEEMEAEGIAPNAATLSVIISGFAKLGNTEYALLSLPYFCAPRFLLF